MDKLTKAGRPLFGVGRMSRQDLHDTWLREWEGTFDSDIARGSFRDMPNFCSEERVSTSESC